MVNHIKHYPNIFCFKILRIQAMTESIELRKKQYQARGTEKGHTDVRRKITGTNLKIQNQQSPTINAGQMSYLTCSVS